MSAKGTSSRTLVLALGLLSLPAAGLAVAAAAYNSSQIKARDALFRCIERTNSVALNAIVTQRGSAPCPPIMQFKIEQDRAGRRKVTTLQPLSMQGTVQFDDGKTWKIYEPDKRQLVIQPSPRTFREDTAERMKLAEDNYRFSLERNGVIAGRSTWVVTATPKAPEMPVRRYSIDVDKNVLLRLETVEEGKRNVLMDTLAVSFPSSRPSEAFDFKPVGNVRTIQLPAPERIESLAKAREEVGFEPVLPKHLPFGFVILEPQISGVERARYVAVRLSDGLIKATVYQWDAKRLNPFGDSGLNFRLVQGVRIALVGELPGPVQNRLLDLFVKEATKVFRAPPEPPAAPLTLRKEELPAAEAPEAAHGAEDAAQDEALLALLANALVALHDSEDTL
jgi:outer membrane lipoprotein-sorting protein